jgi:hypothetical protein
LDALIQSATRSGTLSPTSRALIDAGISGDLGDLVLAGARGASLETIEATDVLLVTLLLDASSSIHAAGLEQAIRDGSNTLIDTFRDCRESDSILLATWLFNHEERVLHSYVATADATKLDAKNYAGVGGTRLFDTYCDALAANVAYAQQLRDAGTPTRSVLVVLTDGEDCGSKRRVSDCAALSKDVLRSEQFVLAFIGVGDAQSFRSTARAMGIPDGCVEVLTHATPESLRRLFHLVSQSALQVSRGAVSPGPSAGFFR